MPWNSPEQAALGDPAADVLPFDGEHLGLQAAVVEEDAVAGLEEAVDVRVGAADAAVLALHLLMDDEEV